MTAKINPLLRDQRVFVNRTLNMASIRSVGFDMDHTLVQYNRHTFESLAFHETLKKFLSSGYPAELETVRFDPNFVIRGLLVDRERGNLLKVDQHKYVKVAYHGRRCLDKQERHQLYNAASYRAQNFLAVDTFFALSEVQLFTEIVDYMARHPGKISKSYAEVYGDLREFIDLSHRDGSIKEKVVAQPEHYLHRDRHVPEMLGRLREAGKELFLLTNSLYDYTEAVMAFCLDKAQSAWPRWQDYFEHIIVGAGKPGFFKGSQPFYEVVGSSGLLRLHSGAFKPGVAYQGGNAHLFQELTGKNGDEILYCGDHIYTDIIRSKELFNWRTMLVVEELAANLSQLDQLRPELLHIGTLIREREAKEEELQRLSVRRELITRLPSKDPTEAASLQVEQQKVATAVGLLDIAIKTATEQREQKIHPMWGDVSRCGLEKSRFARQIEDYACIYSARVSNLRHYNPYKRFTSDHDLLPHEH